jgi:DnaJ-class molecular chaperone
MDQRLPDFNQIMKLAQQVATQITPPDELKTGKLLTPEEMTSVIGQITNSVSEVMTPELMNGVTQSSSGKYNKKQGKQRLKDSSPISGKIQESKISFDVSDNTNIEENSNDNKTKKKKRFVEIESDESDDNDPISPRTKDMVFTLSTTLEELYNGSKKKLALRHQKIDKDGSYQEEKKKLSIKIMPGMIDEQTIRFNHMADEKQGYETGDVVVNLAVEEHSEFVRDGNNLILEKEISLSEVYNPIIYINHLNGKILKITGDPFDIFSDDDGLSPLKKVTGLGMPILGEPGMYGDLFIRFNCINRTEITPELIEILTRLFPPLLVVPDLSNQEIIEKQFELVTESDLEFLESDDDYDSDDEDYDSEESSDD